MEVWGHPDEDLVVRLPGQPKIGFNQYAGYVDVGIKNGRSLFYHFVEADAEPEKKPLTLWINGGLILGSSTTLVCLHLNLMIMLANFFKISLL